MKVLCGEDQPLVRLGLEQALRATGAHLVAVVDDRAALVDAARELRPDVVLVSHRLLLPDGAEAVAALALSGAAVLVLAERERIRRTRPLIAAGARGVIRAEADEEELAAALLRAVSGDLVLPDELQRLLLDQYGKPLRHLSPRELEILVRVARGWTNPDIAADLFVSLGTVKEHLQRIFEKLGVTDRGVAALRAIQLGMLDADAVDLEIA
jgi:two-component system nitrate/nitrite response regulator NarL